MDEMALCADLEVRQKTQFLLHFTFISKRYENGDTVVATGLPPCHQFKANQYDHECRCVDNRTYYYWQSSMGSDGDDDSDGYLGCWNETSWSK